MKAKAPLAYQSEMQQWVPLLEVASQEVFELMLGCKPALASGGSGGSVEVTAMVGLAGELSGVLSIQCDGPAAALMASKMLNVPLDQVRADMSDAFGEICNMVAGNFKNKVSGLGDGCMLSPPTVITGSDYSLHSPGTPPTIQVGLVFESLPVLITLQIDR